MKSVPVSTVSVLGFTPTPFEGLKSPFRPVGGGCERDASNELKRSLDQPFAVTQDLGICRHAEASEIGALLRPVHARMLGTSVSVG